MNIKTLILASTIFLLLSCGTNSRQEEPTAADSKPVPAETMAEEPTEIELNEQSAPSQAIEDLIIEKISRLPEYKDREAYIDSLTNHQKGLSIMVDELEDAEHNFYAQVGFSGEDRFETYYHFYIDTPGYKLYIEDIVEGDVVTLDTWRERN